MDEISEDNTRKGQQQKWKLYKYIYMHNKLIMYLSPNLRSTKPMAFSLPFLNDQFPYSEILLAPHEIESGLGIHIALHMKCASEWFRPTEENSRLSWGMDLANRAEDHVPVWTAEVCWRPQSGDGVLLCICIVYHNIGGVIDLDSGGKVLSRFYCS